MSLDDYASKNKGKSGGGQNRSQNRRGQRNTRRPRNGGGNFPLIVVILGDNDRMCSGLICCNVRCWKCSAYAHLIYFFLVVIADGHIFLGGPVFERTARNLRQTGRRKAPYNKVVCNMGNMQQISFVLL